MYHDRQNGNYPATVSDGKFSGKIQIARYDCSFPLYLLTTRELTNIILVCAGEQDQAIHCLQACR